MAEHNNDPLPENWSEIDSHDSFFLGVQLAKEAVARGEPMPEWLRSAREERAE